ncbi:MAG: phosphohydrolase, partial [Bacteroidia bacterium]|nr:phosphohydrolase [Bacteroidia bacterium]
MKDVVNRFYRNHALIYKAMLFVLTTFVIVNFFPKSGKFKYSFERGKPWQSENLYAPFDFAIKKTDEELEQERSQARENASYYFDVDSDMINAVSSEFNQQFTSRFPDSINQRLRRTILQLGQE